MLKTKNIWAQGVLLGLFLIVSTSCEKSKKRHDLSELNEYFGYQSATDNEEPDSLKQYYDPEVFEWFVVKLDNDNLPDSVFLRQTPINYEPGKFYTILIKFSSGRTFKHGVNIAFDKLDKAVTAFKPNQLKSEYLQMISLKGVHYLMLSGYKAECCPRNLSIIKISGNQARLVFNKGFELNSISDNDSDGVLEITGRTQYYQIFQSLPDQNAEVGTYSPFEVYLIKDAAEYNLELSKAYNEKNYVWAGERINPSIHVLYPHDYGKASIYKNNIKEP